MLLAVAPREALALTCAPTEIAFSYESADVVFEGKVISAEKNLLNDATTYTFDVIRVWKGDVGSEIVLGQGETEMIWGYSFENGETYIVMAVEDGENYNLPLCGFSLIAPYENDEVYDDFVNEYGEGTYQDNGEPVEEEASQWINLGGFVVLTAVTIGLLVVFLAKNGKANGKNSSDK